MIPATSQDVDAVLALTFPNIKFTGAASTRRPFLQEGRVIPYSGTNPQDCAQARGVPTGTATNIRLASQSASYATQAAQLGAQIAGATVSAIPIVGTVVQGVIQIFSAFSQAHQQAVINEQTTLCTIVPAVNRALAALDDGVISGSINLPDALSGLDAIESQYKQGVAQIIKEAPGQCNAACQVDGFVQEQLAIRRLEYPGMVPPVLSAIDSVFGGTAVSGAVTTSYQAVKTGLTKYWPIAILAVIIILLFRRS